MNFMSNIAKISKKTGILGTQEFQDGEEVWIQLKEGRHYLATPANIEGYDPLTRFYIVKCTDTEAFKSLKKEPPVYICWKSFFTKEKPQFG